MDFPIAAQEFIEDSTENVRQSGEWPVASMPAGDTGPANDVRDLAEENVAEAAATEVDAEADRRAVSEAVAAGVAAVEDGDAAPANDTQLDEPAGDALMGGFAPTLETVSDGDPLPADRLSAHFLSRLERLSGADLDRAMRLYYHHDELRRAVTAAVAAQDPPLPADKAVAIALDETPDAPRVIVSRTGSFITCLGRGMHFAHVMEMPYAKFEEGLRLRAEIDESYRRRAELRDRFGYGAVFRTLYHMGAYLPREHVDWITAHGQVVGWVVARKLEQEADTVQRMHDRAHFRRELTVEQRTATWRREWALYHQILICGELKELKAWKPMWGLLLRANARVKAFCCASIAKMSSRWPTYARRYFRAPESFSASFLANILAVTACVGLAHPGRKEQCVELLASMAHRKDEHPALARVAEVLLDAMECVRRVPLDEFHVKVGDVPEHLFVDPHWMGFALVAAHRPLRECLEPLALSIEHYHAKLEAYRKEGDARWCGPPTRKNEGPVVGRNDPCPCQSGRKFKKCCLGKAPQAAAS